jgi:rhamnosyltransferase
MQDKICAIIVTWNSGKTVESGVMAVEEQVDEIVIVDNGSSSETLSILEDIKKRFNNVTVLYNNENLGIAAALKRGVKYAMERGYDWVLTLDDDSEPEPGMVQKMLDAYYSFWQKEREKIAILAPNYTIIKGLAYRQGKPIIVPTAITSGQLVKTEVFHKVGFYKEDLFIDGVDHEFCLRLLKFGFKTLLIPNAVLKQRFGPKPILKKIFGKKIVVANHAPLRYYYIYRNSLYLYTHYFLYAPAWILRNGISIIYLFGKIILFEKERPTKIKMITRGLFDGLRGKYGKL